MKINTKDLSIVIIEKESLYIYNDFVRLVNDLEEDKSYLDPMSNEDIIDILNNEGQIFMFKCRNVYASSCLIKKNSREEVEYCELAVFQDFRGNKISEHMIKEINDLNKRLGYKDTIIKVDEKDVRTNKIVKNSGFEIVDTKEYDGDIKNIYHKSL